MEKSMMMHQPFTTTTTDDDTMSPTRKRTTNSSNSSNTGLLNLYTSKIFCDTRLIIVDNKTNEEKLSVDTHRIVLYSTSMYMKNLFSFNEKAKTDPTTTMPTVFTLGIDFDSGMTIEIVALFFGLLYVPSLDVPYLSQESLGFLNENILFFYNLAIYYAVDTITAYCEKKLFSSFSLDHFKIMTEYSLLLLHQTSSELEKDVYFNAPPTTTPTSIITKYTVLDDKLNLYSRYLWWYQCCVDRVKYTKLPLVQQSSNYDMDVEQSIDQEYFTCKKKDIMNELETTVENIDRCRIPKRRLSEDHTHIQYYRRICVSCITTRKYKPNESYYINMGVIRQGNEQEGFSFRLKNPIGRHNHYIIEMARNSTLPGREIMSGHWQCHTRLTLLSSKRTLDQTEHSTDISDIGKMMRPLCIMERHDPRHCYISQCDNCKNERRVYIIVLEIRLDQERVKSSSPGKS